MPNAQAGRQALRSLRRPSNSMCGSLRTVCGHAARTAANGAGTPPAVLQPSPELWVFHPRCVRQSGSVSARSASRLPPPHCTPAGRRRRSAPPRDRRTILLPTFTVCAAAFVQKQASRRLLCSDHGCCRAAQHHQEQASTLLCPCLCGDSGCCRAAQQQALHGAPEAAPVKVGVGHRHSAAVVHCCLPPPLQMLAKVVVLRALRGAGGREACEKRKRVRKTTPQPTCSPCKLAHHHNSLKPSSRPPAGSR